MATLPQSPEELLETIKTPLNLFERLGVNIDIQNAVSGITDRIPTDTGAIFPWLRNLWEQARGFVEQGDIASILSGLWELIRELLRVVVGLLSALVDLLRSLIASF
ncbi:MAG: hypothetical protein Q8P88_00030 [Candidatus Jorgensenbacteria bacterium]|nr:hypothetical protein [Candidatus Jorgensenbacteria bacterium]